jgi:CheY-like chemotaxis protein
MDVAKTIPVIMITGGDPAIYQERALAAGAVSFFPKPFLPEGLLAVIQQILGEDPETFTNTAAA